MSPLRFRAWHQEKMVNDGLIIWWDGSPCAFEHNFDDAPTKLAGAVVMQSTGLYDKNGKEIFEGDICQIWNAKGDKVVHSYTGEVYFDLREGGWQLRRGDGTKTTIFSLAIFCRPGSSQDAEVIGNIYQNPELLPTPVDPTL